VYEWVYERVHLLTSLESALAAGGWDPSAESKRDKQCKGKETNQLMYGSRSSSTTAMSVPTHLQLADEMVHELAVLVEEHAIPGGWANKCRECNETSQYKNRLRTLVLHLESTHPTPPLRPPAPRCLSMFTHRSNNPAIARSAAFDAPLAASLRFSRRRR
jgi:hypothetical protein